MRRSASLGFAAAVLAIGASIAPAQGPGATGPSAAVVRSNTSISIPGVFGAKTGMVGKDSPSGCGPGVCFEVPVTVRANSKWELQVTLTPASPAITVGWVESRSPLTTRQLTAGTYLIVASGTTATPAQEIALMFNANNTTGEGGPAPTAAQLAAALSFRVIAAP